MRKFFLAIGLLSTFCGSPAAAQTVSTGQFAIVTLDGQAGGLDFSQFDADGSLAGGDISALITFNRTVGDGAGNSVAVTGMSQIVASFSASSGIGSLSVDQHIAVDQQIPTSTNSDLSGEIRAFGTYNFFFEISTLSRFAFSYDVSSEGFTPALTTPSQVGFLREDNASDFSFYTDPLGDGAKGTVWALIGPGSYTFSVQDFYVNSANDWSPTSADLTAQYGFSIMGVPEPASWAMMMFGFGMVGIGMRRRLTRTAAKA